MNVFTHLVFYAGGGALLGLLIGSFTLGVMYWLSRRTERFEPTYGSITIAESLLVRALLILYPVTFAAFATLFFVLRR